MPNKCQDILRSFNMGSWVVDIKSRSITIDTNLAQLLDLEVTEFSFDQFVERVIPRERARLRSIMNALPDIPNSHCRLRVDLRNRTRLLDVIIDMDSVSSTVSQIRGVVRIQHDGMSETIYDLSCGRDQTMYSVTRDVCQELKESTMLTMLKCKVGLIYPCTLTLSSSLVEITVSEGGILVRKQMSVKRFLSSIHPADRVRFVDGIRQLDESKTEALNVSFRSKCLTPYHKWYKLLGEVMFCEDTGLPIKYIGALRDVDHSRRSEQIMQNNSEFLQNMYDILPVGVEIYDREGYLVKANRKDLEIFGIGTLSEILGKSIFDNPGIPAYFLEALRNGEPVEADLLYDLDMVQGYFGSTRGGVIDLHSNAIPMFDDEGVVSNFMVVHLDNTEKNYASGRVRDFENFFSAVVDFAKIGYCKWDYLNNRGFAIDQWFRNFGAKVEDGVADVIFNYSGVHSEDQEQLKADFDRMLSGEIDSAQQQLRIKDNGEYKWVYNNVTVINRDTQNGKLEVMGVNIDMSKLRNVELQLVEANDKTSELIQQRDLVLNNLTTGLLYIDFNYVVQWRSTKALGDLYDDTAYIPGQVCYRTAYNRDTPCEDCSFKHMLETNRKQFVQFEVRGATVEIIASPAFDNQGNLKGGVVRLEDITKRKHNEQKIKDLNRVMDAILNNIPVYMFVKDPNDDFRYLYWNKAMAGHTMIPVEKVIGKKDSQVFPNADDVENFYRDDMRLLKQGGTIEFDEDYYDASGNKHTAHTLKTLVPSDDKLPWLMGVSWDITEMKKSQAELIKAKEKAEESDKFKSSFLANMSHEIRTPLNAIVGFSELLTDDTTDATERKEYVTIIQKNNQLLLQLISDILDLSRIEARALDFNCDRVDIHALCNRIVMSMAMRPDAKVPIVFNDSLPTYFILNDENRVNQVVTNFVTNAIKFTNSGLIEVGYKIISETELEIFVTDTGSGIPSDKIDTIFDRFVKLNSFIQGTGLGLSICKNLVEQIGGRIGVESEMGVGSRFWFTLPFDKNLNKG